MSAPASPAEPVASVASAIERDGFALLPAAMPLAAVSALTEQIESALASIQDDDVALRNRAGLYGARNILDVCPATRDVWRTPGLQLLLTAVLGTGYGLVRGLFFDKPPERSWSLPWHQDLTIAVVDNQRRSALFRRPTRKAGVPHVEAPVEVLRGMLTLRIHLDDVTADNGPLRVLPGTHRDLHSQPPPEDPMVIHARAGDVLAMRPLLFHASEASHPGNQCRRRILHLEFAAARQLPDGFVWHTFLPGEP